jgi:hypothetical protein
MITESTTESPMAAISDKTVTINGIQHTVTAVDGMDRVEINNKLHHIGDQILKLRMEQDRLINMRNKLDQHAKDSTLGDLFLEMFSL